MLRHPAPPAHAITPGPVSCRRSRGIASASWASGGLLPVHEAPCSLIRPITRARTATFGWAPGHDSLGNCDSTLSDGTALGK